MQPPRITRSLAALEQQKRQLVCPSPGEPTCRCAEPDDPGCGPNLRLTYGKTISEALPPSAAVRKTEQEIEFRKFQQLSHVFVEVNEQICRLRAVEESLTPQEMKRPREPASRCAGGKPRAAGLVSGTRRVQA